VRRTGVYVTDANRAYLQAKADRGHMFGSGTFRLPVRGVLRESAEIGADGKNGDKGADY
jgi:hypothetical protein